MLGDDFDMEKSHEAKQVFEVIDIAKTQIDQLISIIMKY